MSDDVRADARRLREGITSGEWVTEPWEGTTREAVGVFAGSVWGPRVAGLIESETDAEFIAAAPTLVIRLLAELDRVTEERDAAKRGVSQAYSRSYAIADELDAALATLQQVREWAEQRRYDGPPTDDFAAVLLDGAAHQLLRILEGGTS